jgi:hypothetical protein
LRNEKLIKDEVTIQLHQINVGFKENKHEFASAVRYRLGHGFL